MLRVILVQLLLFSLPFIGFAIWLYLTKKAQTSENWRKGPMPWLVMAGLALAIGGLVMLAQEEGLPEGKVYKPAELRDGVLIPGHYE
ncbi:MAG: hypothetical protein CMN87_01720 [Stappia sp.]|uniref:DUF6111 family protein n=1 Tax=Stappia sp. TaxID=1870903 RepID=UPI000C4FDBB9|nr:DUF6111 family protein [Stappia sp.]MAB00634.1 hypothetical protein [Stappia sp.]MBM18704.1 hypothetical protein [Stappia sp.]|tara:strand:+ start:734 stop:994 length:261 start_codon:yes stop_codon:yes gene_type:complete